MLIKEGQITVVSDSLSEMTYERVWADLASRFKKPSPTRLAIKTLVKFQHIANVADHVNVQGGQE